MTPGLVIVAQAEGTKAQPFVPTEEFASFCNRFDRAFDALEGEVQRDSNLYREETSASIKLKNFWLDCAYIVKQGITHTVIDKLSRVSILNSISDYFKIQAVERQADFILRHHSSNQIISSQQIIQVFERRVGPILARGSQDPEWIPVLEELFHDSKRRHKPALANIIGMCLERAKTSPSP